MCRNVAAHKKFIFMKVLQLSICFTRFSDADFQNKAEYILACMTGNASFAEPIPTLAEIKEAVISYSSSLTAASGKDRILVAEKNKCRQQLELLLGKLGLYVMYVAMGDTAILASSGYSLVKEREPQYITNPGNVTLTNGVTTGQLKSRVKNVKAARNYLHQISDSEPADNTVWDIRTASRSKFVFKDLQPGKKYWVRVGVTGPGEQIAYSTIASKFVQ